MKTNEEQRSIASNENQICGAKEQAQITNTIMVVSEIHQEPVYYSSNSGLQTDKSETVVQIPLDTFSMKSNNESVKLEKPNVTVDNLDRNPVKGVKHENVKYPPPVTDSEQDIQVCSPSSMTRDDKTTITKPSKIEERQNCTTLDLKDNLITVTELLRRQKRIKSSHQLVGVSPADKIQVKSINKEIPPTIQITNIPRPGRENKEIYFTKAEEEKIRAQLAAASRSMKTNLVLGALFLVSLSVLMIVSNRWRPYFYVLVFSLMKGALPVFTAVANFGTIQFVANQYWNRLLDVYHSALKI